MDMTFRPIQWTGPVTPDEGRRSRWTFKALWSATLDLLDREFWYLEAERLVIEADFTERDIRLDGMPRANARQPEFPGVRLAFGSKYGPLIYATDSCAFWQHNVRSIALGLEALRAVDRYGITRRAEQYQGWKAIGTGTTEPEMTRDQALDLINGYGGIKAALRATHPDHGGDPAAFARVQEARRILEGS